MTDRGLEAFRRLEAKALSLRIKHTSRTLLRAVCIIHIPFESGELSLGC
ncbi:hypothetical protein [Paramicrobacterium agarici]|nr:hypothetical protein [Microbacterium agarici]